MFQILNLISYKGNNNAANTPSHLQPLPRSFNNKSKTDIPEELPGPEHIRAVMPVNEDAVVLKWS